uniref:Uncharacterized protein n=1 Tax=Glossina pallidipes TaxID=7398 RepID=A0A1A9Z0C6_GLOPL
MDGFSSTYEPVNSYREGEEQRRQNRVESVEQRNKHTMQLHISFVENLRFPDEKPMNSNRKPKRREFAYINKKEIEKHLALFGRIFGRGNTDMYAVSTRVFKHKCHVVLFEVLRNHKKQAQQFADISPYAN